eukprot:s178_g48.t1
MCNSAESVGSAKQPKLDHSFETVEVVDKAVDEMLQKPDSGADNLSATLEEAVQSTSERQEEMEDDGDYVEVPSDHVINVKSLV